MLQNNPILKNKIEQLWDKFWSGGISNPLTAIEQITYLLFMKRLDDIDLKKKADAVFIGEPYPSKFEGYWIPPEHVFKLDENKPVEEAEREKEEKERPFRVDKETLRWSHFSHWHAEEMLSHIQTKVFPFLKELNGETSPFTKHMKNAVFIIPKPSLLVEAVKIIDEIFEEIEKDADEKGQAFQDIQGDVYEYLLSEIATAGKNGQFRTPRHIIKLIAELVAPQLGQRIADPACGTGGFLLGAYLYIVTQLDKHKDTLQPDEDGFIRNSVSSLLTEDVIKILEKSLYGYDIDVTMVRLGLMNLIMHGLDNPNIDYKDTLSKGYDDEDGRYNIVMANPPFTGSIDKADINESLQLPTTKTELLFVERIFNILKIGGTAGVIVPQGVLFGSGKAFVQVRRKLIEDCELKAVITMPSGVFKPYAGVSTAILIFTKGGETEKVWFYEMQSDGYSLDDKRTKLNGYGDLQDIVIQYKRRDLREESDRTKKFFFVPKSEIVAENYDLSMSRYKKIVFEEIKYEKPAVILAKLKTMESEIDQELSALEEMLG
ncbi:N-6 DNA methylase [Desulforamulus ruminis]|uniref:type I restriction-modification system subunit M n=1 Tax=Desulforamulus ruminis TaxID=1564 RepID=UPI002FD9A3E1